MPVLWERSGTISVMVQFGSSCKMLCLNDVIFFLGNIPPLVRLLQAYIEKASKVIIGTKEEVLVNCTYS